MNKVKCEIETPTQSEKYSFLKNISGKLKAGAKVIIAGVVEGLVSAGGPVGAAVLAAAKEAIALGKQDKEQEPELA